LALLFAFAFAAGAVGAFTAVLPVAFGAVPAVSAVSAVPAAAFGALLAAAFVTPFTDVLFAARVGVREAAVLAAPLDGVVLALAGAEFPLADSPFAASFREATALSRALVALVIAVSAVLSALADVPALVAAVFSRVAAEVTFVAAAETVRGVAAPGLLAVVLPVVDRDVVRVLLVTVAGLAAAVRVAGLLAAPVVPGTVAVVFVVTDLPLDMDQLRGRHSTESNLLHLTTRKNNGAGGYFRDLRSLLAGRCQFGLAGRHEFGDDPQRLLRRRALPHRHPHQVAGERNREPDHVVRDIPGQRQHRVAHRLRQHLVHRHPEPGRYLAKPSFNVSHGGTLLQDLDEERTPPACFPSGRRQRRPDRRTIRIGPADDERSPKPSSRMTLTQLVDAFMACANWSSAHDCGCV
jgi:hypothetical protein